MPDTQLIALASGIGAATGGFVTMVGNIINNRYLLARDQAQWERDRRTEQEKSDRTREDEQRKWAHEQELEHSKWTQDQISSNAQECFYHLSYIMNIDRNLSSQGELNLLKRVKSPEYLEHEAKVRQCTASILAVWPDKKSAFYQNLRRSLPVVYGIDFNLVTAQGFQNNLMRLITADPELVLGPHSTSEAAKSTQKTHE